MAFLLLKANSHTARVRQRPRPNRMEDLPLKDMQRFDAIDIPFATGKASASSVRSALYPHLMAHTIANPKVKFSTHVLRDKGVLRVVRID